MYDCTSFLPGTKFGLLTELTLTQRHDVNSKKDIGLFIRFAKLKRTISLAGGGGLT